MIREKSPLVKYGITCSLAHVRICIVGCILQITQERLHYLLLASAKPVASILKWLKELITRWSQFMGIQWKLTVTFQKSQNIKKKTYVEYSVHMHLQDEQATPPTYKHAVSYWGNRNPSSQPNQALEVFKNAFPTAMWLCRKWVKSSVCTIPTWLIKSLGEGRKKWTDA